MFISHDFLLVFPRKSFEQLQRGLSIPDGIESAHEQRNYLGECRSRYSIDAGIAACNDVWSATRFLRSRFERVWPVTAVSTEFIVTACETENNRGVPRFPKFLPSIINDALSSLYILYVFFFDFLLNWKLVRTKFRHLRHDCSWTGKVTLSSSVIFIRACVDPADC